MTDWRSVDDGPIEWPCLVSVRRKNDFWIGYCNCVTVDQTALLYDQDTDIFMIYEVQDVTHWAPIEPPGDEE